MAEYSTLPKSLLLGVVVLLQVCLLHGVLGDHASGEVSLEELVTPGVVHTGGTDNPEEDEEALVKGCIKACTDKLMPWPWQRVNGNCAANRQCYVCWGFCSLLQDKQNRASLCHRSKCGSSCRAACNYIYGEAPSVNLGFLVCVLVIVTCTVLAVLSVFYLAFLLQRRRRRQETMSHIHLHREETLSRQELLLLDIPQADKTGTNHKLLQVKTPMAQSLLRLLDDIRVPSYGVSRFPSGGEGTKQDLVQVGFNTAPVMQIDYDPPVYDVEPCILSEKAAIRDLTTLGVNVPLIRY